MMKYLVHLLVIAFFTIAGCSSCNDKSPQSATTSQDAHAKEKKEKVAGSIQVGELKPTVAGAAKHDDRGKVDVPEMKEEKPTPEPDEDCFVMMDAFPDYGTPPLRVEFSADAECSSGNPQYTWTFGDGTPDSTESQSQTFL